MPRQLHWKELTGGVIAAAVIAALTIAILLFARVGGLHGKKVTLYVVTAEAPGVLAGTEVWLAGEKEGVVKEISFRPATVPQLERILITTEFLKEALPNVRRDSYARIRSGGSVIGPPVVYISSGTLASPPLGDGDTVHARRPVVPTDLSEGAVRQLGLHQGLVDNKVCAIDDTWSGLRFVFRLADRPLPAR